MHKLAYALTVLLLRKLPNSQGCFSECCRTPPAEWDHHRPFWSGHRPSIELSAKHYFPVGTKHCRPAKSSCWICFDSSRRQNLAWQCISSNVCTNHTPYHVSDSKGHGLRFLDHQSRNTMPDGPKNQVCILIWNAMHIIKQIELNLYHSHFKRSSMHTHTMQS